MRRNGASQTTLPSGEAILGNVVRAGQKLNVPIPALESVYAVAKMVEGKRA